MMRAVLDAVGDHGPFGIVVVHRDRDVDTLPAAFEHVLRDGRVIDGHTVIAEALDRVRGLAQLVAPGVAHSLEEQLRPGVVWVLIIGPTGAGVTAVSWATGGPLSRFDA